MYKQIIENTWLESLWVLMLPRKRQKKKKCISKSECQAFVRPDSVSIIQIAEGLDYISILLLSCSITR